MSDHPPDELAERRRRKPPGAKVVGTLIEDEAARLSPEALAAIEVAFNDACRVEEMKWAREYFGTWRDDT